MDRFHSFENRTDRFVNDMEKKEQQNNRFSKGLVYSKTINDRFFRLFLRLINNPTCGAILNIFRRILHFFGWKSLCKETS